MPAKLEQEDVLLYMVDGDRYLPVGHISEIELEGEGEEYDEEIVKFSGQDEIEIKCVSPRLDSVILRKLLFGSNNWRKMHGLPMISRRMMKKISKK